MLVAGDIIKKCAISLKDTGFVRWTESELLAYLDEAQREVARNPGAYTKTVIQDLAEGSKQALPADTFLLVTVVRNWNDEGHPTLPVRITTRSLLDSFAPAWHIQEKQSSVVENYVYDDRTPMVYFVYPPNDGTGHVELVYNAVPEKVSKFTDVLAVRDVFEAPLVMYVLYRAYSKDSDYSAGLQLATTYFTAYTTSLQTALQSVGSSTPNASLVAGAIKPNGGTE